MKVVESVHPFVQSEHFLLSEEAWLEVSELLQAFLEHSISNVHGIQERRIIAN